MTDADKPWFPFALDCGDKGRPYTNLDNLSRILKGDPKLNGMVWFDTFHQRIFTDLSSGLDPAPEGFRREWEDADDLRVTAYIQGELKLPRAADELVRKA